MCSSTSQVRYDLLGTEQSKQGKKSLTSHRHAYSHKRNTTSKPVEQYSIKYYKGSQMRSQIIYSLSIVKSFERRININSHFLKLLSYLLVLNKSSMISQRHKE